MLYNDFKALITCGKTGTLSSMRFINLIGSMVLLFCVVWSVINNMDTEKVMWLIIGFGAINGAKTIQSKFEK